MATRTSAFNRENAVGANNGVAAKRMPTRATSRSALGEIGNKAAARPGGAVSLLDKKCVGTNNRQTKVAGRRAAKTVQTQQMDVDKEVISATAAAVPATVAAVADNTSDSGLPPGVPDIDRQDEENPQLCAEYVPHMYAYLRELEGNTAIKQDFLKGCPINGKMRGVLLDWLIEVHLQFKLLQETLYMTVAIIDRFLQVDGLTIRRNKLQLVGVTAMFIASKVEEMYAPECTDFVYITDNAFTAAEIRAMELRILTSIKFGLGRPLPLHFLRRNSKAGDVDVLQHTVAKYLLEACITEYEMSHFSPSLMAAAALNLSLRLLEPGASLSSCWTVTLQHYSAYTHEQLLPIICKIAGVLKKAKDGKLQAVHTKYLSRKFLKVADMTELKGEIIQKLAVRNTEGL